MKIANARVGKRKRYEKAVKTLMFTGKVLRNQTNNLIGRNKTAEEVNLYHSNMNMKEEGEDSSPRAEDRQGSQH